MTLSQLMTSGHAIRPHVLEPFGLFTLGEEEHDGADPAMSAALREAHEKGVAEGKRQTEATLAGAAQALGEIFERLQAEHAASQEARKHDMLRLSMAIAKQIAMCELQVNRDAVAEMVSRLLDEAEGHKVFAVRLNPRDAAQLKGTLAEQELQKAQINLHVSEEVPPGGCVLETAFGRLDAHLETRIEELSAMLLGPQKAREIPAASVSAYAPIQNEVTA